MIFYEPRYGLGNIIQATPSVRHLARQQGGIDGITIVETPQNSQFVRAVFRGWRIGSGPATNDTGLYHAAAALDVPAVALFTFTDTDKNYDPVFHRRTRIITTGMECQPCQLTSPGHWLKLQPLCGWACRDIPPRAVFDAIKAWTT